jgi:hypothetical protein
MDNQDWNQMAKIDQVTPNAFTFFQNHPNPFKPETRISCVLSKATQVHLSIYNILGQKVKTLVDGFETAGRKTVRWDGKDEGGNQVTSEVYFYKMCARGFV